MLASFWTMLIYMHTEHRVTPIMYKELKLSFSTTLSLGKYLKPTRRIKIWRNLRMDITLFVLRLDSCQAHYEPFSIFRYRLPRNTTLPASMTKMQYGRFISFYILSMQIGGRWSRFSSISPRFLQFSTKAEWMETAFSSASESPEDSYRKRCATPNVEILLLACSCLYPIIPRTKFEFVD
jgi:hypothetical protein